MLSFTARWQTRSVSVPIRGLFNLTVEWNKAHNGLRAKNGFRPH